MYIKSEINITMILTSSFKYSPCTCSVVSVRVCACTTATLALHSASVVAKVFLGNMERKMDSSYINKIQKNKKNKDKGEWKNRKHFCVSICQIFYLYYTAPLTYFFGTHFRHYLSTHICIPPDWFQGSLWGPLCHLLPPGDSSQTPCKGRKEKEMKKLSKKITKKTIKKEKNIMT